MYNKLKESLQILGVIFIVLCMALAAIFFTIIATLGFTWICLSYIIRYVMFNKEKK